MYRITTRRNQQSCQQCRKDKQKCLPFVRDWKTIKERCERCKKLDHLCGPPMKSQKRLTKTSVATGRLDAMTQISAGCYNLNMADTVVADRSCYVSPEHSPGHFPIMALGSHSIMSQAPPTSSIERRETVRNTLARLADMNTAREMLLVARKYTASVKSWFQELSVFVQSLDVLIGEVETQFHEDMTIAIDNVGVGLEAESDIAVSAILQSHQRFSYPRILGGNRTSLAESTHMQKILHLSRRTRKGATSDPICGSTREIIPGDDDKLNNVLAYLDASEAIAHVLEALGSGNRPSKTQHRRGFSADQLAYAYHNKAAAIQLWTLCQDRGSSVDVIGRNLLHLVVHNSDHEMLRRILSLQGTFTAAIDAVDIFGVTPLEIAACQNDLECFSLLRSHGARDDTSFDKHGDSLIALAERNQSPKIVRFMLDAGGALPVSSPGICEAVKLEDQETMGPAVSGLKGTASSPHQEPQAGTLECGQVEDFLEFVQDDFRSDDSFPALYVAKDDSCISVLEHVPLLSFDNSGEYNDWADIPNMEMDTHFCFQGEFMDYSLPVGRRE